ncbi:hypothetical protein BH11ACT6_BH11ACT6_10460 [soil metagenome]
MARPDVDALLPLSTLPTDRVIRVQGPTVAQMAVALDPLPAAAPVVISCELGDVSATPTAVRDHLLERLEAVARAQVQTWLPTAEHVQSGSAAERRTTRLLAKEIGTTTEHFGPFLADLADAALTGQTRPPRFDPETRARGLARLLCSCYGRDALVLMLFAPHRLRVEAQQSLGTAGQWLANTARIGGWILGDGLVDNDRFPVVTMEVPDYLDHLLAPTDDAPVLEFPVLTGRPHPGSTVEMSVEAALAGRGWARGRAWNQLYCPHPLALPLRVDLMWPTERVVVELDGPDHRGALKYADDRRRDNALTLGGYAVLRLSNDEVTADLPRALAMIEELLATRRRDEGTPGEDRSR